MSASECASAYSAALRLRRAGHVAAAARELERAAAAERAPPLLRLRALLLLLDATLAAGGAERVRAAAEPAHLLALLPPAHLAAARDALHQLRLRAGLALRLQQAPPPARDAAWLFLRAHQQYVNGDLAGAVLTLGQYRQFGDDERLWAPLNNDLGVLYSAMKKHNLSVKYMQQALKEHALFSESVAERSGDGEEATLRATVVRDRPLYVYNLGASLLRAGRPEDAFDCLVEATRHFPNDPRVWLRLAECCVAHRRGADGGENVKRDVGSGAHSKSIPGSFDGEKYSISGESYAIPTLSYEFAALCLMNATTLLPQHDRPADPTVTPRSFRAGPGDPMSYERYCDLRDSALLLSSYVSLRLNDCATALERASEVLLRPASPARCALARLYSAEALLASDRIAEAIELLDPNVILDRAEKMAPASRDILLFAARFNGAVCHSVRGDSAAARNVLLRLNSPRTLPLQLYLETCAGNVDNCRTLLRKFNQMNLSPT